MTDNENLTNVEIRLHTPWCYWVKHPSVDKARCNCGAFKFPITLEEKIEITHKEAQHLYRILEYQYVPYEDEDAHTIVNKIANFANKGKNELAQRISRPTQ